MGPFGKFPAKTPTAGFVRPAWADPLYLMLFSEFTARTINLPGGNAGVIAGNNPRRIGIGFSQSIPPVADLYFAPFPEVGTHGYAPVGANLLMWFSLFEFGPMVCYDWYATSPGAATIMLHEWVISN